MITFVIAWRRSLLDVPELLLLKARLLRQPSAYIPEGPEPLLVSIAAFHIISLSIDWNLTRWIFCKGPFCKISCETPLPSRCFWISFETVSLFRGNTPFSLLFISKFGVELMLPFDVYCLNFFDVSAIDDGFCMALRDAWIISSSKYNSLNSPMCYSSKRRSNASWWSFHLFICSLFIVDKIHLKYTVLR